MSRKVSIVYKSLLNTPLWMTAVMVICGLLPDPAFGTGYGIPPSGKARLHIAVHCAQKVLQLWRGTELVEEYPIEIGKGGVGKKRSGDHRTPLGNYEISWMASRNAPIGHRIVDGRSWCRGNKFIDGPTGPALEKLWSDAYGGSEATVISINYPNDTELRKGYTGECIHIHAVKRPREGILTKSYGCIHMFPKDAQALYDMVQVGTPVKILP